MGITGFIFMTLTAAEKQGFMTARARGEGQGDRGHPSPPFPTLPHPSPFPTLPHPSPPFPTGALG